MNPITLTQSEVYEICDKHVRGCDKWYRMFCGLASSLKKYEDGIITIKIENTGARFPSNFETAVRLTKKWIEFNKELQQAVGFIVLFYTTKSTGFNIPTSGINKNALEILVEQFKSADKQEKVLTNIFSGLFPNKAETNTPV